MRSNRGLNGYMEASVFHRRQAERVRMLLNRVSADNDGTTQARYQQLRIRLAAIEIDESRERDDG